MCASISKAELALDLQALECLDAVPSTSREVPARRDAFQALLAFSAVHEQVLQRRSPGTGANLGYSEDSATLHFLLDEVLNLVAERALAITGADGIGIALAEGEQIICRTSAGTMAPDAGVRLDPHSGFSGACLRTGQVLRCDDVESDSRVNVQVCLRLGTRSMLAVPLRACGRVAGLIEAFSADAYGFNDADVRSLVLLAELILAAVKPEEQERIRNAAEKAIGETPVFAGDSQLESAQSLVDVFASETSANREDMSGAAVLFAESASIPNSESFPKEVPKQTATENASPAVPSEVSTHDVTPAAEPVAVPADSSVVEKATTVDIEPVEPPQTEPPAEMVPIFQTGTIFGLRSDGAKSRSVAAIGKPQPDEDSEFSLPGLRVVAVIVLVAVLLSGGLLWLLNSHPRMLVRNAVPKQIPVTTEERSVAAQQAIGALADLDTAEPDIHDEGEITPDQVENAKPGVMPRVTAIRHWSSANGTTVVIDLQDQVNYEAHRLASPDRIYVDLHDTNLASELAGKTIDVGDPLLKRVRVAQPTSGISRVVLDTSPGTNFSVSLEPNPYRLVLQVKGADLSSAAKAPALQASTAPNQESAHVGASVSPKPLASAPAASNQLFDRDALAGHAHATTPDDGQIRGHILKFKIVVDAGHGGWDLGTVGRRGLLEKDLVLDISQRLGKLLESRLGTDVVYTRKDDNYVALDSRAELANDAQADLFVSIHANYSDLPSARGVETYYTNLFTPPGTRESEPGSPTLKKASLGSALSHLELRERIEQSRKLAATVQRSLYSTLAEQSSSIRNRGVKEASYVVLTGTTMPAILAEVSFVSSPADETNLQREDYRQKIAEAMFKGIARYAASSHRVKMASAERRPTGE
ncbi:MAG TPA: N-acetylmuramoyl-L-alanine amidase [Terriglobales bacterium]|nr:N-acetylmuramoyl-L-alanine amidase [Terriglobales bacterium]